MDSAARLRSRRVSAAVAELSFPPAVFKTCPWQPQELIETGLRQWLRCCGPALAGRRMLGMPSRAADEAWHGFILCTAMYSTFCKRAYGQYLHHHPAGAVPADVAGGADPKLTQLSRTVTAWYLIAEPDEECVLWDLDARVGVDQPWGVDLADVARMQTAAALRDRGVRSRR